MEAKKREIVDFNDAREVLDVSRSTLLRWLKEGRVVGYKTGRKWKFYEEDLHSVMVRDGDGAAGYRGAGVDIGTAAEELRRIGIEGDRGELGQAYWCGWQDREEWLWLACTLQQGGAILTARYEERGRDQTWSIAAATGNSVVDAWRCWDSLRAAALMRPGRFEELRGAAGEHRCTLVLTASIERVPPWEGMGAAAQQKRLVEGGRGDWLVTGPTSRRTAAAAYALARALGRQHGIDPQMMSTAEHECTFYWPGVLQTYGRTAEEESVGDLLLLQLDSGAELLPRHARSPRIRVAYAYAEATEEITVRHVGRRDELAVGLRGRP